MLYCCPVCKGKLSKEQKAYLCALCNKKYPIILDIPDFRVYPDPYISYEDDRDKGRRLAEKYPSLNFDELVKYYWEITPETPKDFAERFIRYARMGAERGENTLNTINLEDPKASHDKKAILELGCGSGGLLAAASNAYRKIVGIDIAFRWLVIAKKQLEEVHTEGTLICCCADYLPFKGELFDLVVAVNVIEQTQLQKELVNESNRVLKKGGTFFAVTVNRLSLAPEPHVKVWGVGFLPRKWMGPYVQFIKNVPYKHIKILSIFEIKRILSQSGYSKSRIFLPKISEAEIKHFSKNERLMVSVYRIFKSLPLISKLLLLFGPLLNIVAWKDHE